MMGSQVRMMRRRRRLLLWLLLLLLLWLILSGRRLWLNFLSLYQACRVAINLMLLLLLGWLNDAISAINLAWNMLMLDGHLWRNLLASCLVQWLLLVLSILDYV